MMLKIALTAAAMSLLTLGAATAGSPEAPKTAKAAKARSQCFWTDQVNNFASSDDRIVNLRVGVKDYYQLEMLGRCQDVDWTQSIAIVSRGSSSTPRFSSARVASRSCWISAVTLRMSLAALWKRSVTLASSVPTSLVTCS